jgi:hypothetical protein
LAIARPSLVHRFGARRGVRVASRGPTSQRRPVASRGRPSSPGTVRGLSMTSIGAIPRAGALRASVHIDRGGCRSTACGARTGPGSGLPLRSACRMREGRDRVVRDGPRGHRTKRGRVGSESEPDGFGTPGPNSISRRTSSAWPRAVTAAPRSSRATAWEETRAGLPRPVERLGPGPGTQLLRPHPAPGPERPDHERGPSCLRRHTESYHVPPTYRFPRLDQIPLTEPDHQALRDVHSAVRSQGGESSGLFSQVTRGRSSAHSPRSAWRHRPTSI